MHAKGITSLVPAVVLCFPSFTGAMAALANVLLQRHIEAWGTVSSVAVATAVFIGWPLIVVAAVVGGLVGLSHGVSQRVKYAHYIIVSLATLATFALTFHFGM
jgi:ribose/xylose/arabinose/galactoside ABC-type transport system permease subunit